METDINSSAISVVLILMAIASLFTMLSLNQISYIVHGDLYNYGLQFSYKWAMLYWVSSGVVFGLSWVNIALSIIITLYVFKKSRRSLVSEHLSQSEKIDARAQRRINEYVESQKEELPPTEEEHLVTPNKELIGKETKQPEGTIRTAET